ncbi:MAG: hypothetical protein ACE5DI_02985 [Candidatus Micrarchaeia archaeon]
MSRKKDLETMASFVGNSAAHVALLPGKSFALKEAATYTTDASELALSRAWNKDEVEFFKKKARQRTKVELHKRIKAYGFNPKDFDAFFKKAEDYMTEFIDGYFEKNKD